MRPAVGDGVVLAADRADANAAERKNPGFHRGLADDFDDLAHIDARIEIGGIFKREMRHVRITPKDSSGSIKRSNAHRTIPTTIGLNRVAGQPCRS